VNTRRMKSRLPRGDAHGFSLMEVMVATIVICVGLLGIAKMQGLALSNATTSRLRALAAIEAASFAATMHSNRQYWANTPPVSVTVNTGGIASTDAALAAQATTYVAASPSIACFGTSGGGVQCAALQLAAFDLARWWNPALVNLLPNAAATISCPPVVAASPTNCTIQITWTEKAVSSNKQEDTAAANAACLAAAQCFERPTYTLYVEP
jgi:type IV pilus assembly protein PilV